MVKNYPTLKNLLPLFFLLFSIAAFSQTFTDNSPGGTETFTIPAGVWQITVEARGAGGAGGGSSVNFIRGGGGGAGGSYASSVINVLPGQIISYNVGSRAIGIADTGANGGGSWVVNITTVFAQGGAGGQAPNGGVSLGGIGSISSSIGSTLIPGISGSNGTATIGAAGGAGANSGGAGGLGWPPSTDSNNGNNGSAPGGGGGGAFVNTGASQNGGSGGNGQVSITYVLCVNPAAPTVGTITQPTCSLATGSVVLSGLPSGNWTINPGGITGNTPTRTISGLTTGTYNYTVTSASNCTSAASVNVVINAQPATPTQPTLSAVTQPTCSIATGSVVLSDLPSGNWTINPGAITGTGTSITISGLAAGTYNYTVTNAAGCTSGASANVVINAEPANNVWRGSADINWNNAANWCTGVPSVTNNLDVVIPSAATTTYSPTLSSGAFGYVENILFESGSILTVENNYLFVKNILTLNGKIDLNNEAQLLQDTGSTLDIASAGTIEIDQQGTGNSFRYNYWSSPVNSNLARDKYTIGAVLKNGTNPVTPITFGASHTFAEQNIGSSPIQLSTYWMYVLRNSNLGYSAWYRVGNTGEVSVGEGYTMKGSNTTATLQNYTFVGKPNNGDISLTLNPGFNYLVGNPYPSAIDVEKFILGNPNTTGVIYLWEHYGGDTHNLAGYQAGYATRNIFEGVPQASPSSVSSIVAPDVIKKIPGPFIPVGQAFFVVGNAVGGSIQFKNSQRDFEKESDGYSIFMKSSNLKGKTKNTRGADLRPKIRIGYDAPKISHRQLLFGIDERATPGVDWGFDAEIYQVIEDDMYWILDGKKYVIQVTNEVGLNSEVPLGIQLSKTGKVTVKIDALENVDDDTTIYLKDKVTGESFNMREKPVQLNLTAGKYADRFVLVFKTQKLVAEDVKAEVIIPASAHPIIEGIHVFMNNAIGELQIKNNSTEEIVSVALINSLGQTVKTWNSNFNIRTISLPISTATGVYLVQINTKTGKTVKKISVE